MERIDCKVKKPFAGYKVGDAIKVSSNHIAQVESEGWVERVKKQAPKNK